MFAFHCTISIMRQGPLSCVWIETGNPQQPLACVWIDKEMHAFRHNEYAEANEAELLCNLPFQVEFA